MSTSQETPAAPPSPEPAWRQEARRRGRTPLPRLPPHKRHLERVFLPTLLRSRPRRALPDPVAGEARPAPDPSQDAAQTPATNQATGVSVPAAVPVPPTMPGSAAAAAAAASPTHECNKCHRVFETNDGMVTHRRREHGIKCRWPGTCSSQAFKGARGVVARVEEHLIHHNAEVAAEDGRDAVCHWPGCDEEGVKPSNLGKHLRGHNKSANPNTDQYVD